MSVRRTELLLHAAASHGSKSQAGHASIQLRLPHESAIHQSPIYELGHAIILLWCVIPLLLDYADGVEWPAASASAPATSQQN